MKHDCKFFVEYMALDLLMDQVWPQLGQVSAAVQSI